MGTRDPSTSGGLKEEYPLESGEDVFVEGDDILIPYDDYYELPNGQVVRPSESAGTSSRNMVGLEPYQCEQSTSRSSTVSNGSLMPSMAKNFQRQNEQYGYSVDMQPPRLSSSGTTSKSKRKHVAGQKKPCNCTKSMCLKLYCDCFANGEFCENCNCKDCRNNMTFDADRTKAIKQSLERNPNAFKPKIGIAKSGQADVERLHQKGCHCKKSGCLKNYCECYEAKVPCTERCKCKGCQNTEADRNARQKDKLANSALMNLANAATCSQSSFQSRPSSPISDEESEADPAEPRDPRKYPWFYLTDQVVKAAADCMIAQADDALKNTKDGEVPEPVVEEMERLVLREFGQCLEQIFRSASNIQ